MKSDLRSYDRKGTSYFLHHSQPDVYNLIVKFLGGSDINIDNILAENVPTFWIQSNLVTNNLVVCAKFFHLYMNAFIHTLLGFDSISTEPCDGMLGHIFTYYGCVEAQGRGSLYCHMLIWLVDSVNPNEIKDQIDDSSTFLNRLLAFLEDSIATSVLEDLLPNEDILSLLFHPSSIHMPSLDGNVDITCKCLQKDVHFLADCSQTHRHTFTCFKYWWGPPEPRQCRFELDPQNYWVLSSVNFATREISLQCLNGMINNYNLLQSVLFFNELSTFSSVHLILS